MPTGIEINFIYRMSVSFKGQENVLLRRPAMPRPRSSQDASSEQVSDLASGGKNSSSGVPDGMLLC